MSNVLLFLSAMFAFLALWLGIAAGSGSVWYGLLAVVLAVATVITFRTYRRLLRTLDAQESAGPDEQD
jgi:uncharacterized membrane protein YhiD involved in acid resistance